MAVAFTVFQVRGKGEIAKFLILSPTLEPHDTQNTLAAERGDCVDDTNDVLNMMFAHY